MQMRILALALLAAVSAAQDDEITLPVSDLIRHTVTRDVSQAGANGVVSRYYEGYYDVTETVYDAQIYQAIESRVITDSELGPDDKV